MYTLALSFVFWTGLAAHTVTLDDPEVNNFDNPLFEVGVAIKPVKSVDIYCSHESSITKYESGYGFNKCGIRKYW